MGYTFLYTKHIEQTVQLYRMMPDLVKVLIMEGNEVFSCFKDEDNCILSPRNLDGIPVWKMLSFNFWTGPSNPLGRNWTLSPDLVRATSLIFDYIDFHGFSTPWKDTPLTPTSAIAWNLRVCCSHLFHTLTENVVDTL
jgi:hypothetical protein